MEREPLDEFRGWGLILKSSLIKECVNQVQCSGELLIKMRLVDQLWIGNNAIVIVASQPESSDHFATTKI